MFIRLECSAPGGTMERRGGITLDRILIITANLTNIHTEYIVLNKHFIARKIRVCLIITGSYFFFPLLLSPAKIKSPDTIINQFKQPYHAKRKTSLQFEIIQLNFIGIAFNAFFFLLQQKH